MDPDMDLDIDREDGAFPISEPEGIDICPHPLLSALTVSPGLSRALQVLDLPDDITIVACNSGTETEWTIQGEASPMVSVGVLLEGTLAMTLDGGPVLTLGAGTILLHAAGHSVSGQDVFTAAGPLRLVDVRFPAQTFLPVVAAGVPPGPRDGGFSRVETTKEPAVFRYAPASPAARRTALDILACGDFQGVARSLYLRAKALELLAIVLRDMMPPADQAVPMRDRKRVVMARRLLDQDYETSWTLDRLSRTVGLSEKKLRAGFRQMMGTSVQDHLRSVRLAAAMAMLERGQSVTETAYAVGFSSLSHFSKAFKDQTGLSPRDWAHRCPGL